MGSKDLKAKIRLEGDSSDANREIKKTEKGIKRLGASTKKMSLGTVAAFAAAAIAIRAFVKGIGAAIKAANVQEDAINALNGALADLGPEADKVSKALQEQAAALQQITKVGDEEIIQAQSLIASFVKEESAIKAATIASLDLAEAKGFSLVTAADLISKTLGSSTNALTRYGIVVEGAVGSTERLASLTENIATAFGGRAQKAADTFSGKVQQLSNAFGDMQEEIGFAVTKNKEMIDSIEEMKGNVEDLTPQIASLAEGMVTMSTATANALVSFGKYIGDIVLMIDGTGDIAKANEDTEISFAALDARAAALGITIKELRLRLKATTLENRELGIAAQETAGSIETEAQAAERAADAAAKLAREEKEAATAMEKLGTALGIVTSAKLDAEILDIEQAMQKARDSTEGFSQELIDMEAEGAKRIKILEQRSASLAAGLGDIVFAADDAGNAIDDLGEAVAAAAVSTDKSATATRGSTAALSAAAAQARITTGEYVRLGAVAETVAIAQARTALRQTQRARGVRGSSTSGGGGIGNYGLSAFGTGGLVKVNADGILEPA